MELRVISAVLFGLAMIFLNAAQTTGFGPDRGLRQAFQPPAFVDRSDHQVGMGAFSPLDLPGARHFATGGAKFVRASN